MSIEKVKCFIIGLGFVGYIVVIYIGCVNIVLVLYEGLQFGGQLIIIIEVENFFGYFEGISGI